MAAPAHPVEDLWPSLKAVELANLTTPTPGGGIDGPSNMSRADPSGAVQIDAEQQATDLAVGVRIPRGAPGPSSDGSWML
jgi:hypothetical protein